MKVTMGTTGWTQITLVILNSHIILSLSYQRKDLAL